MGIHCRLEVSPPTQPAPRAHHAHTNSSAKAMGRCCRRMMCKAMCHSVETKHHAVATVPVDGRLTCCGRTTRDTVKALQILLKNAGIPFVGPVDGYIGRRTVRAFQTFLWANGVNCGPVDGRLGKRTIQGLQSWLAARGHYVGPIDGKLTKNTVKALQTALNQLADCAIKIGVPAMATAVNAIAQASLPVANATIKSAATLTAAMVDATASVGKPVIADTATAVNAIAQASLPVANAAIKSAATLTAAMVDATAAVSDAFTNAAHKDKYKAAVASAIEGSAAAAVPLAIAASNSVASFLGSVADSAKKVETPGASGDTVGGAARAA